MIVKRRKIKKDVLYKAIGILASIIIIIILINVFVSIHTK